MNEIIYDGIDQEMPKNMTRVLIEHVIGPLEFAFYKDGMFQPESSKNWISPKEVKSWMGIPELKKKVGL